ncbi:reticulon-like protein B4 [Pyrus x bretschneideri]|uniref:reticulon-like protein B4 n=1 Tax=Pyrus x bretschneideri TaxID=225117 RepID=UPI00202F867B|nr:reticulon-like protein B4 [Pyrus x bretschneideri]
MHRNIKRIHKMLDPVDVDIADSDFLTNQSDLDDSSDSDIDNYCLAFTCKNRLFGRQKPLHVVLGAGVSADIILWRNKQISAYIFMGATLTWLLFERLGYSLVVFFCHASLLSLTALFLWSNFGSLVHVSAPEIPEIVVPQHLFMRTAISMTTTYNQALRSFGQVVFGTDIRDFLAVAATLWVLSVAGSRCSFLSFLYLVFVILMTVPALYENLEDSVDSIAEKALIEIKKQYAVLDGKVLQKLKKKVISYKNKKQP